MIAEETWVDRLLRKAKAPPVCRDERCCGTAWQQLKARSVRAFLRFDSMFATPEAALLKPWRWLGVLLMLAILAVAYVPDWRG